MKRRMIICLLSFLSIMGKIFAQENVNTPNTNATMNNLNVSNGPQPCRFDISLSKGNHLQIFLNRFNDIYYLQNIDSILNVYLNDIKPFKDSLSNELNSRRINYIISTNGTRIIHLLRHSPEEEGFLLRNGEIAQLKSAQDTIGITRAMPSFENNQKNREKKGSYYYSILFYLNRLDELSQYTNGQLEKVISKIEEDVRSTKGGSKINNPENYITGSYTVKDNGNEITGNTDLKWNQGHSAIELSPAIGIQNYKNYFVPSAYLGLGYSFTKSYSHHTFSAGWEPFFTFEKNNSGSLQTYRNDFITLGYAYKSPTSNFFHSGITTFSLSYLVGRRGEVFDKNTFRLSLLGVQLHEVIHIEPQLYFHGFFKNVTPGLRISVGL